ncbi:MAG: hypothetical protein AAGF89_15020 [Bacteroidota bacterium]
MSTFTESDLLFTFPDDWVVRKFDDTVAYQSLSGHGLKGVDFIALSPDGKLWLMEVKNYRPRQKAGKEYRAKRRPPAQLAAHVAKKFSDTHRLLKIVDASLRKRWWSRIRLYYLEKLRPNTASNYWFWTEAKRRADQPESLVVYVLWLETPEVPENYDEATRRELLAHLEPRIDLFVVEGERPHPLPISVSN